MLYHNVQTEKKSYEMICAVFLKFLLNIKNSTMICNLTGNQSELSEFLEEVQCKLNKMSSVAD